VAATRVPAAVALIGFMGAGKSAVGRELAAKLEIPFVDTDDLIVARAGRPIDVIFSSLGEAAFRALEAEIVVAAVADALERPRVLALGGGAVLSADVRAALTRLSHVVWLTAPLLVLWERAKAEGQAVRPLASDEAAFGALLAAREPLFRRVATKVVDVAVLSPHEIATDLAAGLSADAGAAQAKAGGGAG
jgi:shikimate kinase